MARQWTLRLKAPPGHKKRIRKRTDAVRKAERESKARSRAALAADTSRAAKLKKKEIKEQNRLRQQRYRQKVKESKKVQPKPSPKPMKGKDRKEYFRLYRRKERAAMSRQKKLSIKQKDRERYWQQKEQNKETCEEQNRNMVQTGTQQSVSTPIYNPLPNVKAQNSSCSPRLTHLDKQEISE